MSTEFFYRCVSHEPYIESDEIAHNITQIEAIRNDLRCRDEIVEFLKVIDESDGHYEFVSQEARNRAYFLKWHPKCEIEIWDEYGRLHEIEETHENYTVRGGPKALGEVVRTEIDDKGFVVCIRLNDVGKAILGVDR